ncbi:response regulator [Cupriavidus sp. AU9028]|uniref:hybrid sensor histidine kinase/response regulator n=1 Tax=Cupriavidus sp. AU9028 TaxID=2871157 RepID=UPI001C94C69D|nr:response regulator [Cupriavidus sp. AU9028]MBY4895926.1 response regulator [Cupriavidus sp. AU9028]
MSEAAYPLHWEDSDDRGPPLVLVVDDNPVTRYSTARLLTAAGYRTVEADTGQQGIERADESVSAVVLDVHLPDMDGFAVCECIRANPLTASLPVIHLSAAYVDTHDKVKGLDSGANAYLTHPVEPMVLTATVSALIRASAAERRMRRSEARFRAIYHQAVGGICVLDAKGRFLEVNPALVGMLGRAASELVGTPLSDLLPAEFAGDVALATAPETGASWRGTLPIRTPAGKLIHLDWNISAALDSGSRVAVVSDITERIELELQRDQLIEREQVARTTVERLNRMKDEFIAILSHELRNPINVISVWSQIMARHATSDESRRGLAAINRSIRIQQRLINDLVDASALNVGKMQLQRELVDPAELIQASLAEMQATAAEKRVTLHARLEGLPQRQLLDPGRFQQIVWNLVSNAIKFSPADATVHIDAFEHEGMLHVQVIDRGVGIPSDFMPFLFDRFTQSEDASRRRQGGLGLGLAISSQLAAMHGGTLRAKSGGSGLGSTFEIVVPVLREMPPPEGEDEPGPMLDEKVRLEDMDVLIVEDDVDAASALSTVLRTQGASTRLAGDYDAALAAIEERKPALIVSDIGLPGHDGNALIRELRMREARAGQPHVPAVALTAFTRDKDRKSALEAGFDALCGKPMQRQALMRAIAAAIRVRAA